MNEPRAHTNSQDSPKWGLHPNVILSWDFQVRNLEIPEIETLDILKGHNFLCKPSIKLMSKQKL